MLPPRATPLAIWARCCLACRMNGLTPAWRDVFINTYLESADGEAVANRQAFLDTLKNANKRSRPRKTRS